MSNKTAVEWLEYQFLSPATLYSHSYIMDKLKQAKAMEKDQIMYAYHDGQDNIDSDGCHIDNISAEQYYEENYGK